MDPLPQSHRPEAFRHATVRHLVWLCTAPQLLESAITFRPLDYLTPDHWQTLARWDRDARERPELLHAPPPNRLGYYFERLYQVLLGDLLGWDILLKNLQIREHGKTLGELDFVVRNPVANRIEHHEIAIKYYLGVPNGSGQPMWFGPNARDRLDLKTERLLKHQSRRTEEPATLRILANYGITGPLPPRIFMPGYLFYPKRHAEPLPCPATTSVDHLRGHWQYHRDVLDSDVAGCVPLNKPHWIGPWRQKDTPNPDSVQVALQRCAECSIPQLFARLTPDHDYDAWIEAERFFVLPDGWPGNCEWPHTSP